MVWHTLDTAWLPRNLHTQLHANYPSPRTTDTYQEPTVEDKNRRWVPERVGGTGLWEGVSDRLYKAEVQRDPAELLSRKSFSVEPQGSNP